MIARYVAGIEELLDAGLRVVLVYPIPEAGWNVPEELARRRERVGRARHALDQRAVFERRQRPVIAAFDAIDEPAPLPRPPGRPCSATATCPAAASTASATGRSTSTTTTSTTIGAGLVAPVIIEAIEAARRDADPRAPAAVRPALHRLD